MLLSGFMEREVKRQAYKATFWKSMSQHQLERHCAEGEIFLIKLAHTTELEWIQWSPQCDKREGRCLNILALIMKQKLTRQAASWCDLNMSRLARWRPALWYWLRSRPSLESLYVLKLEEVYYSLGPKEICTYYKFGIEKWQTWTLCVCDISKMTIGAKHHCDMLIRPHSR